MVRVLITLAAFGALFHVVSVDELLEATRRIPLFALALCVLSVFVSQLLGVARSQLLLDAYGADRKLHWLEATRLFFVAGFYNTYLPGAIAGDVMRAVALRACFSTAGLTSALTVGFVERVLGVAGMLLLTAAVGLVRPIAGIPALLPFSFVGLVIAVCAVGGIVVGRRIARFLPRRLAVYAESLPSLVEPRAFVWATATAVLAQASIALGFHAIIRSLSAHASVVESLVIVPLACAAAYVPATVAGAGTRDAAFVFLYRGVGVPPADALAMSLAALFCAFLVAGVGGIASLFKPYRRPDEPDSAAGGHG